MKEIAEIVGSATSRERQPSDKRKGNATCTIGKYMKENKKMSPNYYSTVSTTNHNLSRNVKFFNITTNPIKEIPYAH